MNVEREKQMQERRRILIVDDERFNINILTELLKPSYRIMAALSGAQALKAVRSRNSPDLILLDVMMPEMDGYAVCRELKAEATTRDIPVIFVTAMGQENDETKGFDLGAADYITKPISPAIVEARVRTQMERLEHLDALQQASALIESQKDRMESELNVGRDIQLSMLPLPLPPADAFEIDAQMQAAREVSGDFYDFFFLDEAHLCVCVGDVSGKGVPAALFMAVTKALIRSRAADDSSPASILTHVNDEIAQNNEACMFVTVFLGVLDIRTGELSYSNAGHNPPYVRRATGAVEALDDRHGPALGVVDGFAFKEAKVGLEPGDTLLVFSDGVTEAMNAEQQLYGEGRLEAVLREQTTRGPAALLRAITGSVEYYVDGAEQSDDITLLAVTFRGALSRDEVRSVRISMGNELAQIAEVIDKFGEFAQANEVPGRVAAQLKLVFDELLNNIVSYGFPEGGEHEVVVEITLDEARLIATVTDDGIPFNPLSRETPDVKSSLEDREIGGVGIHLVKNLIDDVSYKRGINRNIVTLAKILNSGDTETPSD